MAIATQPAADRRRRIGRVAGIVGLAVAAARFLSVDIAGIVTNDSTGYLERSSDPFGEGFVTEGYRQVAYPVLMWISNTFSDLMGWDHIFGMALAQRTLLAVAIGVAVWAMRWWSVPIVLLATSAPYVMQSNFLLTEALLVPLALICGSLLAAIVFGRVARARSATWTFGLMCATTLLAASIKMQYATMLALCAGGAWLLFRAGLLRPRTIAVGMVTVIGSIGFLATVQSIENRHEYGVFEPISERSLAEWYGAWTTIFDGNLERAADPALAEWYDGGNLYTAFAEANATYPEYSVRQDVMRERISDMFRAVGTSENAERVQAFLGGLAGGRTDDIGFMVDIALDDDPGASSHWVTFNAMQRTEEGREVVDQLNEGETPGFVSFGEVFDRSQWLVGDYRGSKGLIAIVAFGAMLLGLAIPGRHRVASLAIVTMCVFASAALATGYIDNARYLLGALTVAAVGGVVTIRGAVARLVEMRGSAPRSDRPVAVVEQPVRERTRPMHRPERPPWPHEPAAASSAQRASTAEDGHRPHDRAVERAAD